ncbi:MAG TPA: HAD family phosphatase [Planctomycetota bacterium]|nr:HAD family phosphatase [Planctomycetota bacterium]
MPQLPPKTAIEAVIFDLDGVLVSSIPIHYEAFRRTFAAEGRAFTFEDYLAIGAGAARDVLLRRVLGELEDAKLAELMAAKEHHVRDLIVERGLEEVPGAREFVAAVRARGCRTAVGTSSRTPALLLGDGFDGLFDAIVDRTQVSRPKPDPEIFLLAAERLGIAPERCLVLEDSPAGVEAGLAASMTVIALTTSEPPSRLERAHAVLSGYDAIDLDEWIPHRDE